MRGGGGGGGAIRFNKASMPKAKAAPRPVSKPGDPSAAKGTGEYGNVFFASGSAEEITLMTLEPTPREKPKTNPNLPSYMQPVPKKRDRRERCRAVTGACSVRGKIPVFHLLVQ